MMNFDYAELTKSIGKDKLSYQYLEEVGAYPNGFKSYILKGVEKMKIRIHKEAGLIELKANLPYYWQGHNFHFTKATMIEALQHTSDMLNINLFQAELRRFEFACILEVDQKPDDFLNNHLSYKGKPFQEFLNKSHSAITGKEFQDDVLKVKLYDAGLRIKQMTSKSIRQELELTSGYDQKKNYIKLENHYKNPNVYFKNRYLFVNEVLQEDFMQLCKDDLIETYKSIMKTGLIKIPTNKKDLNVGTLPLILLKELGLIYGFNPEELMKQRVKAIPEDILSFYDKKARQGQLKQNWRKVASDEVSQYDILKQLESKEIL
jgi:hypothetical protein